MLCGLIISKSPGETKKALNGDKWSLLHLWFHGLEDKELTSLKAVIEGTV